MCGFCGFTGELIKKDEILEKMMDKIVHRAPTAAAVTPGIKLPWALEG